MYTELEQFGRLKQQVEAVFRQRNPACQTDIHDWKGKQIKQFQEDLTEQVGGYLSEKWFYTHLKVSENTKLPRLDMLDMLAQYVGAKDWATFCLMERKKNAATTTEKAVSTSAKGMPARLLLVGTFLLMTVMAFVLNYSGPRNYRFCIVDRDDGQPIAEKDIQAYWNKDGESPLPLKVDSFSCVILPGEATGKITIQVQALYYQPMTITRRIDQQRGPEEQIQLQKDDYALMIHYFSTQKMEDWKKRRSQLDKMLSNEVRIIEISDDERGTGMAMYNKEEFINKMTLPISSLKNIQILKTKYLGKQIIEIRFVQKND